MRSIESTEAMDAWRHAVRGMWYLNRHTADDVVQARDAFDAAVRIDPRRHFAWYGRCLVYQHLLWEQLSDDPARDLEALRTAAAQCLRAALAANPSSSQASSLLRNATVWRGVSPSAQPSSKMHCV